MFISEKVEELLPSYLRFVRGIIDSSDLPLNISREMLQQSPLIAKIRQGTVSRILKELKKRSQDYEDYKKFLTISKTERECNKEIIRRAEEKGFHNIVDYIKEERPLKPGDKIYADNRGKAVILFIIGIKSSRLVFPSR